MAVSRQGITEIAYWAQAFMKIKPRFFTRTTIGLYRRLKTGIVTNKQMHTSKSTSHNLHARLKMLSTEELG